MIVLKAKPSRGNNSKQKHSYVLRSRDEMPTGSSI